ncbi:MAG TPA: EamA family transporter [Vicinamibacterales bacterium]|nr:EamA family transporter [Vicinamibacterales bacterium]
MPNPDPHVPANPKSQIPNQFRAYAAWAVVCIVWGTTYLGIRVALETIPPFVMAGIRYSIAGGMLIAIVILRGHPLPGPRAWPSLAVLGVLLLGFGNGGVVWAEQTVPSGLTAVLVATSPFWMVGLDALLPGGAPLSGRRTTGLVVGFIGIVLLVLPEIQLEGGRAFLGGVAAAQLACVGWAVGSIYARRRGHGAASQESVLATAAFEMLFGSAALFAAAFVHREYPHVVFTARSAGALAYLIVFGAVIAFSAYSYALKHLPVATVSLYAYVNPVIAVALGTVVLDEPFNLRMLVAAGVVLAGMALVRGRSSDTG